ncbi:MAG: hypothetical protein AVDCRST_MAG43-1976 [uncultured Thermomicrobiales bacterium]|uniref:Uncharacterized protein n=1 Tax=uncultured Thermomicrobiales bacterium TaxID=1645740 RepID=A0A6J4UW26_9BACT|nr:MAG: hypothetical protein AVDCRST_MAG43-1976 [uncultured Thermomicrobiales bacterium]
MLPKRPNLLCRDCHGKPHIVVFISAWMNNGYATRWAS